MRLLLRDISLVKMLFRRTILEKVVAKYEVDLSNHLEGKKKMYRSRPERIEMNQEKKTVKSNQFPRPTCDRDQCVLCKQQNGSQKKTVCDKGNVGYEYTCTRCPTKSVYVGESSRTAFTRLGEHMADYRAAALLGYLHSSMDFNQGYPALN